MNIADRLLSLENRLDSLQESFIQSQINNVNVTTTADEAKSGVEQITPYTDTKTAYIEDTEVVFENVTDGELTVYVKDSEGNYPNDTVERMGDIVKVSFEPLEYVTTVTISIL